jgi:hypothetical protein
VYDSGEDFLEVDVHIFETEGDLSLDLNIDSDNSGPYAGPDHSDQEEYLESNAYGLGKLIIPNTGDADNDGVLNCWDGYDVGTAYTGQDAAHASEMFVPITVALPENIDYSTVIIVLSYDMASAIPTGNTNVAPAVGSDTIRIWTKNGTERRDGSFVTNDPNDSGDLIASNYAYKASSLGFSESNLTVTFYVEGVALAAHISTYADVKQYGKPTSSITVKMYPTGKLSGPVATDTVNYIVAGGNSFYYQLLVHEELRAAMAAQGVYGGHDLPQYCMKKLSSAELLEAGFSQDDIENLGMLNDTQTGFSAGVYHDYISGKNILTFEGTTPTSVNDWKTNISQGLGLGSSQYDIAMSLGQHLKDDIWKRESASQPSVYTPSRPTNWLIAGHSLGGGLAAAASMVSNFHAITFNAAGVSLSTLHDSYRPDLTSVEQMHREALGLITSYVVDWNILNNVQDGGLWVFSLPTSLGTRIKLDSDLDFHIGVDYVLSAIPFTPVQIIATGDRLYTMVQAHSYYIQCLLFSYNFPLE